MNANTAMAKLREENLLLKNRVSELELKLSESSCSKPSTEIERGMEEEMSSRSSIAHITTKTDCRARRESKESTARSSMIKASISTDKESEKKSMPSSLLSKMSMSWTKPPVALSLAASLQQQVPEREVVSNLDTSTPSSTPVAAASKSLVEELDELMDSSDEGTEDEVEDTQSRSQAHTQSNVEDQSKTTLQLKPQSSNATDMKPILSDAPIPQLPSRFQGNIKSSIDEELEDLFGSLDEEEDDAAMEEKQPELKRASTDRSKSDIRPKCPQAGWTALTGIEGLADIQLIEQQQSGQSRASKKRKPSVAAGGESKGKQHSMSHARQSEILERILSAMCKDNVYSAAEALRVLAPAVVCKGIVQHISDCAESLEVGGSYAAASSTLSVSGILHEAWKDAGRLLLVLLFSLVTGPSSPQQRQRNASLAPPDRMYCRLILGTMQEMLLGLVRGRTVTATLLDGLVGVTDGLVGGDDTARDDESKEGTGITSSEDTATLTSFFEMGPDIASNTAKIDKPLQPENRSAIKAEFKIALVTLTLLQLLALAESPEGVVHCAVQCVLTSISVHQDRWPSIGVVYGIAQSLKVLANESINLRPWSGELCALLLFLQASLSAHEKRNCSDAAQKLSQSASVVVAALLSRYGETEMREQSQSPQFRASSLSSVLSKPADVNASLLAAGRLLDAHVMASQRESGVVVGTSLLITLLTRRAGVWTAVRALANIHPPTESSSQGSCSGVNSVHSPWSYLLCGDLGQQAIRLTNLAAAVTEQTSDSAVEVMNVFHNLKDFMGRSTGSATSGDFDSGPIIVPWAVLEETAISCLKTLWETSPLHHQHLGWRKATSAIHLLRSLLSAAIESESCGPSGTHGLSRDSLETQLNQILKQAEHFLSVNRLPSPAPDMAANSYSSASAFASTSVSSATVSKAARMIDHIILLLRNKPNGGVGSDCGATLRRLSKHLCGLLASTATERLVAFLIISLRGFLRYYYSCESDKGLVDETDEEEFLMEAIRFIASVPAPLGGQESGAVVLEIMRCLQRARTTARHTLPSDISLWAQTAALRLPVLVINLDRRPDRWRRCLKMSHANDMTLLRLSAVDGQQVDIPESEVCSLWDSTFNANFDKSCFPNTATRMTHSERGCAASHIKAWRTVAALCGLSTVLGGGSSTMPSRKRSRDDPVTNELESALALSVLTGLGGGWDLKSTGRPFALSSTASDERRYYLILEDDAKIYEDLETVPLRVRVNDIVWRLPVDFDICYLGYALPLRSQTAPLKTERDIFWRPKYLWQLHSYIITGSGAAKLLAAMPVDGPVDNFIAKLIHDGILKAFAIKDKLFHQLGGGTSKDKRGDSDIVHSGRTF